MTESSGTVLKTGGEERHAEHDAKDHVDPSENFLWLTRLVLDVMHRAPFVWPYTVIEEAADLDLQSIIIVSIDLDNLLQIKLLIVWTDDTRHTRLLIAIEGLWPTR